MVLFLALLSFTVSYCTIAWYFVFEVDEYGEVGIPPWILKWAVLSTLLLPIAAIIVVVLHRKSIEAALNCEDDRR